MFRQVHRVGVYRVFLFRFVLVIIFMSLSRLLFYSFNIQFFKDLDGSGLWMAFMGGIRFDLSAAIVLNALYIFMNVLPVPFRSRIFWQIPATIFYYIFNILSFALNSIDTVYFRFTSKRMTADIFSFISTGEDDIITLIPRFISDFAVEFISWIVLSVIFVWLGSRMRVRREDAKNVLRFYVLNSILFLLVGTAAIIGIRGGFQLRPITIINAGQYTNAKNVSLVLNTPFSIIKSYGHTGISEVHYFEDERIPQELFNPISIPLLTDSSDAFKPYNVVVIILESFGTEYIGALNNDSGHRSYTPNLDTIISNGMAFRAYSNGKQSMEALPAIVAGLPSLTTRPYITSAYGSNNINSLASLLKVKGYTSAFYHGGRNGTMGFESFIDIAGFDAYYGKDEYGNDDDFDGNWGIYDEPFYHFFKDGLDMMRKPFVAGFFSLSSHHPYSVPEKYKGQFNKGTLAIHESIMYADHALGSFFKQAAASDWFENTLFIITADHTSLSYEKEYQTRAGIYAIPLIFYMPGKIKAFISEDIAQQTDILPSVMGFLKYDMPFLSFGNDLFDENGKRFSISHLDGTYQLIKDGYSLHFDGKRASGFFMLKDKGRENLLDVENDLASKNEMFLKAIIQQYNHRMLNNQLIVRQAYE